MKPYQRRLQRKLKEEKGKRENANQKMFKYKQQRDELVNIIEQVMTEEQLDAPLNKTAISIRQLIELIKPMEVAE
jgi:hypothetical protein